MKTYRPTRELLSELKLALTANRPSFHHSPLDEVIELLRRGRNYSWIGIYLAVGEKTQQLLGAGGETHPGQMALSDTRSKILVTIKLAGRELGVLSVESDRDHAFGAEDRVLLENVANALGRFLTGTGKYLVRKARTAAANTPRLQARGPQAASSQPLRSVAVGEK